MGVENSPGDTVCCCATASANGPSFGARSLTKKRPSSAALHPRGVRLVSAPPLLLPTGFPFPSAAAGPGRALRRVSGQPLAVGRPARQLRAHGEAGLLRQRGDPRRAAGGARLDFPPRRRRAVPPRAPQGALRPLARSPPVARTAAMPPHPPPSPPLRVTLLLRFFFVAVVVCCCFPDPPPAGRPAPFFVVR